MIPRASLNAVSFTLQGMGPILHNGSGEVNDLKKLITELEEMQCVGISERLRDWCSSKEKATRLNPLSSNTSLSLLGDCRLLKTDFLLLDR